jgi:hypothetical protein
MSGIPSGANARRRAWGQATGSTIIITTGGLTNNGTVNFSGDNSIYIGAGGWTDNNVTNFGNGNFSIAITGDWTTNGNMGTGNYSVSVTGSLNIGGSPSTIGAGIYYISGNLNINGSGGQTVTANNVTLVLTGTSSKINYTPNNATFTLTAPTTAGWNQGIAVWEPNSSGSNQIAASNHSVATITGVIYAPDAGVQYQGNTGSTPVCTQIVAETVSLNGNSINLTGNCSSVPGVKIFGQTPLLVE